MKALVVPLAIVAAATLNAASPNLVQTIALPGVAGRIDHLSIDAPGGRLFVAALGNNTVEVVDLKAGKVARSLGGFSEPQGLCFLPDRNRLYVANGGDGSVRVLDATSFAEIARVKFDDDADNVRYDPAAKQIYVGYGRGALGVIDVATNRVAGTIPLTAHPESFQLEQNGPRGFVNVPGAHTIAVIDRTTRKVIATWTPAGAAANFPLALDEAHRRAFVACRTPARLLVFDIDSGREIARLDLHGDCDDVFYDAARRQIYASCGEGFLDVFSAGEADHYLLKEAVKTTARARTSFFDGAKLYLAIPRQSGADARLQVFQCD